MKNKELIAKLQELDPELDVCILDHKRNLAEDSGDGSTAGIYSTFDVTLMDEGIIPENTPKWISLAFDNDFIDEE